MADKTELGCGLMVWQGNRLEDLRDLLLGWLARQPLAPLENDVFLVQSQGMGQWLKLALAGESGVSAAVSMQLPAQFLWRAYRRVLGEAAVPERSALDREALIWRILRLLPTLQDQPVFAPLQHFLRDDGDGRKRYQLAGKLAELFDQYQVYRADWLLDWQAGADQLRLAPDAAPSRVIPTDQLWQPALWRAVLADIAAQGGNPAGRASIHRQFVDALAGLTARPAGLPRRVVVFGISSLPQQVIEALAALGQHSQVVLVAHNPCQHYWGDLADRQAVARRLARRSPQARLPALDSLRMSEQVLGNREIEAGVAAARQLIDEGHGISDSFALTDMFPPLVVRMLQIGETTGELERALDNVAYFYRRDVQESVDRLLALIEPTLTAVLGLLLLWVISAVMAPVYGMLSQLGGR